MKKSEQQNLKKKYSMKNEKILWVFPLGFFFIHWILQVPLKTWLAEQTITFITALTIQFNLSY